MSQEQVSPKRKKTRSDKGIVKLTKRDIFLMRWISEMYAIRFDHLRILLGRYSENKARQKEQNVASHSVTKRMIARWERGGIVQRKFFLHGEPQWVWLTKRGLELIDHEWKENPPKVGLLNHSHTVNGVRLYLEERILKGAYMPYHKVAWIGERTVMRERRERGRRHIVDGELHHQGQVIAIEVELTVKSPPRLASILNELAEDYQTIWYFVTPQTRGAVERAIANRRDGEQKFRVYDLPDLSRTADEG